MRQEVVFGENTRFKSVACSSVEYEVRERFGGPPGANVEELTVVPLADDFEVVEVREVLDCFRLQAVGDGEDENIGGLEQPPRIFERPDNGRLYVFEYV